MPEGAQYARPLLLADTKADMLVASKETFGPVAPLFRFGTEDEAVTLADSTPFGLSAYFDRIVLIDRTTSYGRLLFSSTGTIRNAKARDDVAGRAGCASAGRDVQLPQLRTGPQSMWTKSELV